MGMVDLTAMEAWWERSSKSCGIPIVIPLGSFLKEARDDV